MKFLPTIIILILFMSEVHVLDNGLALTPPMGWLSWGYYECAVNCSQTGDNCLNEKLIMLTADSLVKYGYLDAGYEYVIIDDCWSEKKRDKKGRLVADRQRFPQGMKFLADYVHSKGLKFGLYTCVGKVTCKQYPGSYKHFQIDAETFAEWEIDFLKVDGCFVASHDLDEGYKTLAAALNYTDRPILYACSWPYYLEFIHQLYPNYTEINQYCNMYRTYHDIFPFWPSISAVTRYFEKKIDLLEEFNGPGHWFDPDMLIVGQGLSIKKDYNIGHLRIQMAVYAMISAPFLISCPVDRVSHAEKDLLLNLDLIAISRDKSWKMGKPWQFRNQSDVTIWTKTHHPKMGDKYPSCTFALLNYDLLVAEVGISVQSFPACDPYSNMYTVKDIFKKKFLRNITSKEILPVTIPAEDAIVYTMYPI